MLAKTKGTSETQNLIAISFSLQYKALPVPPVSSSPRRARQRKGGIGEKVFMCENLNYSFNGRFVWNIKVLMASQDLQVQEAPRGRGVSTGLEARKVRHTLLPHPCRESGWLTAHCFVPLGNRMHKDFSCLNCLFNSCLVLRLAKLFIAAKLGFVISSSFYASAVPQRCPISTPWFSYCWLDFSVPACTVLSLPFSRNSAAHSIAFPGKLEYNSMFLMNWSSSSTIAGQLRKSFAFRNHELTVVFYRRTRPSRTSGECLPQATVFACQANQLGILQAGPCDLWDLCAHFAA